MACSRQARAGEIGHTQLPPKNFNYGTGNLEVAANALTSTANFLKAHGWRAGAGYQEWNAATIHQQAIAQMGRQIDGGDGGAARR